MPSLMPLTKDDVPGVDGALDQATRGNARAMSGDTCHVAATDRWGNVVAVTPSGGFMMNSPVIGPLGFPLSARLEMTWLEEGLPNTLAGGKRPRTTLSPTLALRDGEPRLAFGTPGADQQEQWALLFFLAVDAGLDLQTAIDSTKWHTNHLASSLYPHRTGLGQVAIEGSIPEETVAGLHAARTRSDHPQARVDLPPVRRGPGPGDRRPVRGRRLQVRPGAGVGR